MRDRGRVLRGFLPCLRATRGFWLFGWRCSGPCPPRRLLMDGEGKGGGGRGVDSRFLLARVPAARGVFSGRGRVNRGARRTEAADLL